MLLSLQDLYAPVGTGFEMNYMLLFISSMQFCLACSWTSTRRLAPKSQDYEARRVDLEYTKKYFPWFEKCLLMKYLPINDTIILWICFAVIRWCMFLIVKFFYIWSIIDSCDAKYVINL